MSATAGTTCDHCGRAITGRAVVLQLDSSSTRRFCAATCERRWTIAEVIRLRRFALRIRNISRGRARDIARTALYTDTSP